MGSKGKTHEAVVRARIVNSRDVSTTFRLEPWGEEFEMPPPAIFHLVARGPDGDSLEVLVSDDQVTVWGWPGSVVSLFHEGSELGAGRWSRSPVPPMPPIKETRGQIDGRTKAARRAR